MTNRIQPNNFSLEDLCDSAILIVHNLLNQDSLTEEDVEKLERNVKHLEIFGNYQPGVDAAAQGRLLLQQYVE